ncbi:MAG: hypothetical protein U1E76_18065 [Planctomycetota bacterium]
MRLDHPIFNGPLHPSITLSKHATPENYRHYHGGKALPAQLDTWQVQAGECGKTVDYGMVSGPHGFEDSPDAEWISSGINSKGPSSMALGRHGNWFLWGFAGDPTQMTESARQVFLNAIVWMKNFDGQVPLVTLSRESRQLSPRAQVLDLCAFVEAYGKNEQLIDYLRQQLPDTVLDECGLDAAKLEAYYRERLEYMHPVVKTVKRKDYDARICQYTIDETLEDLDVSNRNPEFLDKLGELLGRGDPVARELIDRYLPADVPRDAAGYRAWLGENRARLYFSDSYGYRWFVAPKDLKRGGTAAAGGG